MLLKERNVMNSIKMDRLALLEIVKSNLAKHIEAYTESVNDYNIGLIKISEWNVKVSKLNLRNLTKEIDLTKVSQFKGYPSAPKSYAPEYGRAIRMLELSVEEIIDIEEDVFNQLVLDEWGWKNNFIATSTLYKSIT